MNFIVPTEVSGRTLLPVRPAAADAGHAFATPGGVALSRENLSQKAYLRIRSSLIYSELRPGQKLILRPLAAELGLSPTPVREALLRLVSEQALALDERGSALVPVIGLDEFREIVEIRSDLEGRAACRAAQRATDAEIEKVADLAASYDRASAEGDRSAMLGYNADLHRLVCKVAQAPLILRILEGIWMRIGPVYALTVPQAPGASPLPRHPHDDLIEALRSHDPDAARAAAIADIRDGSSMLEASLAEMG